MQNQLLKCPTTSTGEATKKGRATVLDSIRFLKSLQAIPFVKIDGSLRSRQNSKKHSKTPWQIVQNGCSIFSVTAKNSDQSWHSETMKMHSRIVCGFFCVRTMWLRLYSAILMADGVREPKGSPRFFVGGSANFALVCLLLLGTRKGSLKNHKEGCTMFTLPHTGNPPDKIPLSWRSLATISIRFPVALFHKVALSVLFRRFISVNVPVSASFVNA